MTATSVTLVLGLAWALTSCHRTRAGEPAAGGDPKQGKQLAMQYGCAACHEIPDLPIAGQVGPPLRTIAQRAYLAGRLRNSPENMIAWIRFPRDIDPQTAMPDLGVSAQDAADLTAFLYSLR